MCPKSLARRCARFPGLVENELEEDILADRKNLVWVGTAGTVNVFTTSMEDFSDVVSRELSAFQAR